MKRMIAGAVTAFLIAAGGVLFTAVPASAHTPSVTNTCDKLTVDLKSYQDDGKGGGNTVEVVVNATTVLAATTFKTEYSNSFTLPQTNDPRSYTVTVKAWDDPDNKLGYSKTFTGTWDNCKPVPLKEATADLKPTLPTCTANGSAAWSGLKHATGEDLSGKQTPGTTYTVKATADAGYTFDDGKTERSFTYTLSGKLGADKCVASIEIKVTPPTCDASGHAEWIKAVNATGGTLSQAVGMQSGEATAVAPALFDNGKTTKSYPYEIKPATGVYQSTDPGKPCFKAPTDAYAKLIVHPSTCTDPGSAEWVDVKFATVSVLDQTPGKDNVGVATALQYHVFRDGTSQQSTSYVVPKATGYQSTDPAAPCFEAPKDAAADLKVTPATCTADGSVSWTVLTNATGDALVQTPGTHTGVATAAANHVFADGSATYSKAYTVAAKTPSQSKDASAPCYVKPPSGLAQTGAADMTLPLSLGAGILAAGVVLTAIGIYRRRNSES